MTELLLNDNSIGDAGATAVGNALAVNASLTELRLWNNRFCQDEGAKALASGLGVNTSLKLKTFVVPFGLKKNAQLVAACRAKGVEL